jgi:hypothetical protein
MPIILFILALLLGVYLNYKCGKFLKKLDKYSDDD